MDEYNYSKDMLSSMKAIDGNYPTKSIIMYTYMNNIIDYPKVVQLKITPQELIIYPFEEDVNDNPIIIERIKIDDIEYFKEDGEIYREQVISGGGSGKINVGGAIIGDILAGPAGMVIGGQRKVNEIKSETVEHDTRRIVLSFFINKKNKLRRKISFNRDVYEFFNDNIPEKEYNIVEVSKKKKLLDGNNNDKSVKDRLKELNEMLKDELITQEEYDKKKKELLEKL